MVEQAGNLPRQVGGICTGCLQGCGDIRFERRRQDRAIIERELKLAFFTGMQLAVESKQDVKIAREQSSQAVVDTESIPAGYG